MKKDINNIEQYAVPSFLAEDAWKNMEAVLNKEMPLKQERKRRFAFFWITTFIASGLAAFLLFNNNNLKNKLFFSTNKNIVKNKVINYENNTDINPKKIINKKENTAYKENTIITKSTNNSEVINKEIKVKNQNINYKKVTKNKVNFKNDIKLEYYAEQIELSDNITEVSNNYNDKYYNVSTAQINILKQYDNKINNKKNDKIITSNSNLSIDRDFKNASISSDKIIEEKVFYKKDEDKFLTKPETKNTAIANVIKVPKPKINKNLHYGLQWNILLPQTNNYLDYNAKSQPLSIIIPEFWVSKSLNNKSDVSILLNPYSQYNLRSNNVLNTKDYVVTVLQGSNPVPTTTTFVQTRSLLKAMGVELTAKYTYRLSNNFSVAVGIGNTWLNAAVINDRIIEKGGKMSHDSLYGIAKGFNDWNYLKSSFVVGKFEILYQLNKFQIGVSFVKPIGNIYNFSNTNSNPVNGRAVLRWQIK